MGFSHLLCLLPLAPAFSFLSWAQEPEAHQLEKGAFQDRREVFPPPKPIPASSLGLLPTFPIPFIQF